MDCFAGASLQPRAAADGHRGRHPRPAVPLGEESLEWSSVPVLLCYLGIVVYTPQQIYPDLTKHIQTSPNCLQTSPAVAHPSVVIPADDDNPDLIAAEHQDLVLSLLA